jgi:hypothetical protein
MQENAKKGTFFAGNCKYLQVFAVFEEGAALLRALGGVWMNDALMSGERSKNVYNIGIFYGKRRAL